MEMVTGTKYRASISKKWNWSRHLLYAAICLATLVPTARAHEHDNKDSLVRWKTIVGVITAPGVNNPVSNINSGAAPWSVTSGHARVNLMNGATSFDVDGLVLNGTPFSGTPGPVTAVVGTLVCNAGTTAQAILDTPAVALSAQGDADFTGSLGVVPSPCNNPLFLIRIAAPAGFAGRWIATGAVRFVGGDDDD
jgi:hypothetical protein